MMHGMSVRHGIYCCGGSCTENHSYRHNSTPWFDKEVHHLNNIKRMAWKIAKKHLSHAHVLLGKVQETVGIFNSVECLRSFDTQGRSLWINHEP